MSEAVEETQRSVVVDLGSKKRKLVKRLRKGTGKLMDKVEELVAEMKEEGTVPAGAATVIVVVKEKRRGGKMKMPKMGKIF